MTMERYHNFYTRGAAIFWTSSIISRLPILKSPTAAKKMVETIDLCRSRYGVKILGYAIMPDHFHIMVWAEDAERAKLFIRQVLCRASGVLAGMTDAAASRGDMLALRWSGIFHSKATGKSIVRVWKERGRAFPVMSEEVLLEKLQYIHNNPVKAGLVEQAEGWLFSSARWYANGSGPIAMDSIE